MSEMKRALEDVLLHLEVNALMGEVREKHSLLMTDPETGIRSVVGPFPDMPTALKAWDELVSRDQTRYESPFPTYELIVHFSPEECGLEGEQWNISSG